MFLGSRSLLDRYRLLSTYSWIFLSRLIGAFIFAQVSSLEREKGV